MADIPYVKKKIGDFYLVWFQKSNLYFQLEEPAWFVFEKLAKLNKIEAVAKEFSLRCDVGIEESLVFVSDMKQRIDEMNKPLGSDDSETIPLEELNDYEYVPYSVYRYRMGEKVVQFSYAAAGLERYIHPLVEHLIVEEKVSEVHLFEIFFYKERVVVRQNNNVLGTWGQDESNYTKGKIFLELINILHNKTDEDWLMTVHASAITNGRKSILFSAPPGSGKTTMAALLQAEGYHLISDDFVPFDRNSDNAYPFPIAMSVKQGAMELLTSLYPALKEKPLRHISKGKKVRYLPIENKQMKMVFPAHEIVFIKYDNSVDLEWKKLDFFVAFKLLLEQVWVIPDPKNVSILFDKITQFSFYELRYSNNERALNMIRQLFENE